MSGPNMATQCRPGETLYIDEFPPAPIYLCGLRGTFEQPIVITRRPGYVVSLPLTDPAGWANQIAYRRQEAGNYPVVGPVSNMAALMLSDCQFVLLRDLEFEDCWPTAIYLDRCQNIGIVDCHFRGGTIAIGANGIDTRDILIESCSWQQTDENEMWDGITWDEIHGSYENASRAVDLANDQRQYDGDFFRAWNIAGAVTIRGNRIRDAFNGIHFFNSVDALPPGKKSDTLKFNGGRAAASGVLIEDNLFERVRDNCIEPEEHAWNWVVRNNSFADCYATYSFEFERAGWFFIYNNHHWILNPPGRLTEDSRTGGSGFKCGGEQRNEGGIYVFNNSWLFQGTERLFRKGAIGRLRHYNNAVKTLPNFNGRLFGKNWKKRDDFDVTPEQLADAESKRFTRRWTQMGIEMNGDWICDNNSVESYRDAGYALGPGTRDKDPGYDGPVDTRGLPILRPSRRMRRAGVEWQLELPGYEETQRAAEDKREKLGEQYRMTIPARGPVGAGVPKKFLEQIGCRLTFLPDDPFRFER